jgi:endoglucanase
MIMKFRARVLGRVALTSMLALSLTACPGGGGGASTSPVQDPTPTPTPTPVPTPTLQAVTTADLGLGWNLGNSLDALNNSGSYPWTTSQETYWGNPVVNQQVFNAVAAAGFKSVRIPVSWFQYVDSNGNIEPFWLARVKQVVDMARGAGLYVIVNQHHHNGELLPTFANQAAADAKLKSLWTQIATYFKDYDDHLLFAGTNEIYVDFNTPSQENCTVQSGFNQVFVDAVRATGGNNTSRMLITQGYGTDIENTINACGAPVPKDSATGRLMMEFHYYAPYDFALNAQSNIWQWGSIATDPSVTETWANEAYVDGEFQKLKTTYADKGIPVIIGEYCAISKSDYDPVMKYRNYWDQYITGSAKRHGLAPFYWDAGYAANHSCGLFDRSTGAQDSPQTINGIITAI